MAMTVDRFAGGAIGQPGDRVFLLEVEADGVTTAYALEKIQVAALAQQAQVQLRQSGLLGSGSALDPGGVHADTNVGFRVGGLHLAFDDIAGTVTVVIHSRDGADAPVECEMTHAQLDAFAREALVVVSAGRPECPRCGLAMDPDGHNCPRSNGDLRGHRP
jgi:uncharacterized repeat protein (TIGR03847 family)